MSEKPQVRKSMFAGQTPAAPPVPVLASAPAGSSTGTPATVEPPAGSSGRRPSRAVKRERMCADVDPALAGRAREAAFATRHLGGPWTLSDLIVTAIEREVERLEELYNEGRQFAPRSAGDMPTGRPPRRR